MTKPCDEPCEAGYSSAAFSFFIPLPLQWLQLLGVRGAAQVEAETWLPATAQTLYREGEVSV